MEQIIEMCLIALLGVVIYQDFKYRAVSWIVFPVLAIAAVVLALSQVRTMELVESTLVNLGIVTAMLIGLTLYFTVKERAFVNIINKYIGIADVLLLIVIALLFSPVNFMMYYVGSLLLITVGSAVYLLTKRNIKAEIPLAGAFSIVLIACLAYSAFNNQIDLYDDGLVMELLTPFLLASH